MKFRLRISRALLLISFVVILVFVGGESLAAYSAYQSTLEGYRLDEARVALSAASALEEALRNGGNTEAQRLLPGLIQSTGSLRMLLLDDHGAALAGPASPLPAGLPVPGQPPLTRWDAASGRLQIWAALTLPAPAGNGFLFREVDLSQKVAQSMRDALLRVLVAFLASILVSTLFLLAVWRLVVLPLTRMQATAEKVVDGDLAQRLSPQPLVELDHIGTAFNRTLDRVQAQTRDLEILNRRLETTVENRSLALENANTSLRRQARGLEVLNKILAAAAATSSLNELAAATLSEILQALDADSGLLRILNVEEIIGIPGAPLEDHTPSNLLQRMIESGTLAGLAVPILTHGQVSGRILIGSRRGNTWSEEDEALLHLLGQQIGAAAERIEVYAQTRETNRVMARLITCSEELNQQHSQEELSEVIGRGALDLAGSQRGALLILGRQDNLLPVWHAGVSQRFLAELVSSAVQLRAFTPPDDAHPAQYPDTAQLSARAREWWNQFGEGIHSAALIPLLYEGRINAYIACFYDQTGLPGFQHPEILEAFARQAATALENTRLISAERQQRVLAEALRDVSAALTSTLDPDEVLERILVNLGNVIHHDAASIMMIEEDRLHVIRGHGYPTPDGHPVDRSISLDLFPHVVQMLSLQQIVIIPDTTHSPGWVATPETSWILSYAGAPVYARGRAIGIINLNGRAAHTFFPEQAAILQAFADQAAIALENAQIYQVTRRQMSESTTLYRALAALLAPGGGMNDIIDRIVHTVVDELHVSNCSIFLVDRAANVLRMVREAGLNGIGEPEMPIGGPGLIVAAYKQDETIYAPDVSQHPAYLAGPPETRSELVIPLRSAGTIFALLNMEHIQLDGFDAQTRQTLEGFAERASLVLENARLLEAAREQSRRSDLLNAIASAALESNDIQATLNQIVTQVAGLMRSDGCLIALTDEQRGSSAPLAADGFDAQVFLRLRLDGQHASLDSYIQNLRRPLSIGDLGPNSVSPIRALLGVPLIADGQHLGVLWVGNRAPHTFFASEIALLENAAVQIALGIAKIRSLDATRKQAETSERLRQATAALATLLDFDEVSHRIATHLAGLLPFDCLAALMVQSGALTSVALFGQETPDQLRRLELPLHDPLFLDLKARREPILLTEAQKDARFVNLRSAFKARTWLGVPLFAGSEVTGAIGIGRRGPTPFFPEEILLLQVFANQAGAALQNALLHARQQQLAITDPLTGLYNRRGFMELARHELERSWRFGRPLSLLILDIDHFKKVNDTYGHPTGDEVLRELSQRIRKCLREVDLICRFGGEEFCIMLPESSQEGSNIAAERLRQTISREHFNVRTLSIPVTVSIGLTRLTAINQSLEELIDAADSALLHAKAYGRNRVVEE